MNVVVVSNRSTQNTIRGSARMSPQKRIKDTQVAWLHNTVFGCYVFNACTHSYTFIGFCEPAAVIRVNSIFTNKRCYFVSFGILFYFNYPEILLWFRQTDDEVIGKRTTDSACNSDMIRPADANFEKGEQFILCVVLPVQH